MGLRVRSVVVGACLLVAVASCSSAPPTSSAAPPPAAQGGPPTLAGWKLTLPTADEKGDAAIIDPARVSPPYLTTGPNGALVFWAPVAGATTKNSATTRTELNSLAPFPAGTVRRSLTATVTVDQVPAEGKDVIIAQIHGSDDIRSVPYVMLHWTDGALRVVVKQQQKGKSAETYPLTGGVPLGAAFDIGMTDNGDGTMTFTASYQGDTPQVTAPVPDAFTGATVRFQAGAYQQDDSTGASAAPDDGAKVTFSTLTTG